jgi:ABC-type uncharacterized transport system substrate-binding protein
MSDIKLFRVNAGKVDELTGTTDTIEKSVQTFFEKNLDSLLGVRFLASEFVTSNGRIDSLGLDENGSPVILEYKRSKPGDIPFYLPAKFELVINLTAAKELYLTIPPLVLSLADELIE